MTRAYCLLATATLICNGPVVARLTSLIAPPVTVVGAGAAAAPARVAPSRPKRAAPSAFAVRSARGDDGLFRLDGVANRQLISFIVDTGATTTVLSPRDAALLGLSADGDESTTSLRTASGSTPMVWRRLSRLTIAGTRLTGLDVVVVRDGPDHSLLGQDVLSRLGTITLSGDRLEIRPARR